MKKIFTFITCMICIITTSCGNKSEQDIEKEISSGVVLVQNQSYYEVDLYNTDYMYNGTAIFAGSKSSFGKFGVAISFGF